MKLKQIIFSVFILFYVTCVFADSIYLNDGKVLKGEVIQVTEEKIEYTPEGGNPFDSIERASIERIVFSDGRILLFLDDKIFFLENERERKGKAIESPFQIYLYPSLLLGGIVDTSFTKWAHKRNIDYLERIQQQGGVFANYTIEYRQFDETVSRDHQSGSYSGMGVGLNVDLFYNNFGIGISIPSLLSMSDYGERFIKDENGYAVYEMIYYSFYYASSYSFYYRFDIVGSPGAKDLFENNRIYLRLGAGFDLVNVYYNYSVEYFHSSNNAPFFNDFHVNCNTTRYGYHLGAAIIVDRGIFTFQGAFTYTNGFASHVKISGDHPGFTESSIGPVHIIEVHGSIGINL